MRNLLLATAAAGLIALTSLGAAAAPVAGTVDAHAATVQHVVQADYYYHHHHWHHRRWSHGRYHYWD